jgi:sporadic carbohydrate cluster 2OG-Fe(II) oxygenase
MIEKNYKVFEFDKTKINIILRIIKKVINSQNNKFNGNLNELHNYINKKNINSLRLKCFQKINLINWKKIIREISFQELVNILGPDLQVQSKINLSIQMPGDKSSVLTGHSDSWSSDTPFQINLWIPLTDAYDSNSMFIFDDDYSLKVFSKISNKKKVNIKKPKNKDFISIKFGNYVIFNPSCIHGNILNKTPSTRLSLNLRFKSAFSPEPNKYHQDRKFGTYYQNFNKSKNTKYALKLLNTKILS